MTSMVWDEAGARYYETGVSKGILFPIDGSTGVPWNGLVSVVLDSQGGEPESYYFDGIKYMDRVLAENFQATIQAVSTPKEFEKCEGVREYAPGVKTNFNKRDKFHMAWRTEIGSDSGESIAYKLHIAYNNLVQPSSRNYQTVADNRTMDTRSFVITATPACGRHSYFWFDSREYDLTDLEAQLAIGALPKCWELGDLVTPTEEAPPVDPDYGCPSMFEDFESYFPGQSVDDDKLSIDSTQETYIIGNINNGLDITELPAVGAFAANDSAASEVGTGDILADDDDATYITSADGDLGYTIGLPPLVGYALGCSFELHIRLSIDGDINPDDPDNLDADAQVHISTDAGGDNTIGGFSDGTDSGMGFALTDVSGAPVDYVVPLNMNAWVNGSIDDVATALEGGAFLNIVGVSNNNPDTTPTVNVYEASVVMLDATHSDRALRTSGPSITAQVYLGNFADDTRTSLQVSPYTAYVDFIVLPKPQDDLSAGFSFRVFSLANYSAQGLDIHLSANYPILVWYDVDGATALHSGIPNLNVWYTIEYTQDYESYRVLVYARDNHSDVIFDFSDSISDSPQTVMDARAGKFGN